MMIALNQRAVVSSHQIYRTQASHHALEMAQAAETLEVVAFLHARHWYWQHWMESSAPQTCGVKPPWLVTRVWSCCAMEAV